MTKTFVMIASAAIAMVLLFSTASYAATLVGYWDFNEAAGDTVNDQSSFGNDGTLTGATRSTGKYGNGLFFDGSGGVTIPHSASLDLLPGGFTMSAWIKPTEFPDFTSIFFKTDRHNRIHMLHFQVDGRLHAVMNKEEPDGGFQGFSSSVITLDEWYYVVWTYDEEFMRFWNNGEEVFSAPFDQSWVGNDFDLLIGDHPEIDSARFRGYIDEARIYNGALSRDEILRDMNDSAIPEPSTFLLLGTSLLGLAFGRKSA